MAGTINLAEEFSNRETIPFSEIPHALMYHDETPAHRFTTIVVPFLDGEYCLILPSKDFFDKSLATSILAFVIQNSSAIAIETPLVLLHGFHCPGYSFDMIAILCPSTAKQFEHENDLLNRRAFVAFPAHHCELSGNESPDLVDLIRHDFLPSLDWKRGPCPKVAMAFQNTRTKGRSVRAHPKLTTIQNVLNEVESIDAAEGSWIKLENYAGRQVRLSWSDGWYVIELPKHTAMQVHKLQLLERIKEFVVDDK